MSVDTENILFVVDGLREGHVVLRRVVRSESAETAIAEVAIGEAGMTYVAQPATELSTPWTMAPWARSDGAAPHTAAQIERLSPGDAVLAEDGLVFVDELDLLQYIVPVQPELRYGVHRHQKFGRSFVCIVLMLRAGPSFFELWANPQTTPQVLDVLLAKRFSWRGIYRNQGDRHVETGQLSSNLSEEDRSELTQTETFVKSLPPTPRPLLNAVQHAVHQDTGGSWRRWNASPSGLWIS
jgi:hypothetical protein